MLKKKRKETVGSIKGLHFIVRAVYGFPVLQLSVGLE